MSDDNDTDDVVHPFGGTLERGTSFRNGALRASLLFGKMDKIETTTTEEAKDNNKGRELVNTNNIPKRSSRRIVPMDEDDDDGDKVEHLKSSHSISPKHLEPMDNKVSSLPKNNVFKKPDLMNMKASNSKASLANSSSGTKSRKPVEIQLSESPTVPVLKKGSVKVKMEHDEHHSPKGGRNSGSWYVSMMDVWNAKLSAWWDELPTMDVKADSLLSWEPVGLLQGLLYAVLLGCSLLASFLAIFGTDLVTIFLPTATDQE
jgi:hypothetical protein